MMYYYILLLFIKLTYVTFLANTEYTVSVFTVTLNLKYDY